nr:hypothetical protein [Tanacetum cinerariifolium]
YFLSSSFYVLAMFKNDMKDCICTSSKNDLKDLVKTYHIPLDLHPRFPDAGFTMDRLPAEAIGIYSEFLRFFGVHRLCACLICLCEMRNEVLVRSGLSFVWFNKECEPVFRRIDDNAGRLGGYNFCSLLVVPFGYWFSFSKRHNTKDVCMDDGPSSLKKWKDKFFLIDGRAVPDYLTWRHSCSCVLDDLLSDGYDRDDMQRLCACLICLCEMRKEVLVRSGSSPCQEVKGTFFGWPTIKKRKLQKRASEVGSSAPELGQAEGVNEADLADLCAELEDSLERDEGVSTSAVSAPIPRQERLGVPLSIAVTSVSEQSYVGTSAPAPTFGRSLSLGGMIGRAGKFGSQIDEVMHRQMDPLDCLVRSALARDYDQIMDDDFGTATRGEEIDLTLFPLDPSPYHMPYPDEGVSSLLYTRQEWNGLYAPECNVLCKDIFKDPDVCRNALDRTITPIELKRTESLLPLDFLNHVNVLSALLVSHGYELNSHYTNLVSSRAHLQKKLDKKKGDVELFRSSKLENLQGDCDALGQENRELRSQRDAACEEVRKLRFQLTDAKTTSTSLSEELTLTDAKLSEQALTIRDLQNELVSERSKSQGYKDAMDGLKEEILSLLHLSDEFHVALARVSSLGINYGVERGLHMGRTDVEFEAAVQKVSNFHVGAKADFDMALDDFPTTPFPFVSKIDAVSEAYSCLSFVLVCFLRRGNSYSSESFRKRGKTLCFHPSIGELTMPISAGMTSSVPYARLNVVSSLLILGVVLWANNTFCNSSTHALPSWCNLVLIPCIMLWFAGSTALFACG